MSLKTALLCATLTLFLTPITTTSLTDPHRLDPYAKDNRPRTLMISIFTPVKHCHNKTTIPYMPPSTAAAQDAKYAAYGLPNGTFQSLQLENCEAKHTASPASFPTVLFSGALSTSRLLYTSTLQTIAAAGYLVLSIDHPFDTDVVEFPDGSIVHGTPIETDADIALALATRVADMAFVAELFSPRDIAAVGHSLGGAAAAEGLRGESIRAGVNLDGSMFGSVLHMNLSRPFMLMGHENKTRATDPSWGAVWPRLTGWKREVEVKGSAHYSFSDLPRVVEVLGLRGVLPDEVGEVLGTIEGARMMEIVARYVVGFLDMVFKGGVEGVLGGESEEFPEVVVSA